MRFYLQRIGTSLDLLRKYVNASVRNAYHQMAVPSLKTSATTLSVTMDISYEWMQYLEANSLLCTKNPAPEVLSLSLVINPSHISLPIPHTGKDKFTQET